MCVDLGQEALERILPKEMEKMNEDGSKRSPWDMPVICRNCSNIDKRRAHECCILNIAIENCTDFLPYGKAVAMLQKQNDQSSDIGNQSLSVLNTPQVVHVKVGLDFGDAPKEWASTSVADRQRQYEKLRRSLCLNLEVELRKLNNKQMQPNELIGASFMRDLAEANDLAEKDGLQVKYILGPVQNIWELTAAEDLPLSATQSKKRQAKQDPTRLNEQVVHPTPGCYRSCKRQKQSLQAPLAHTAANIGNQPPFPAISASSQPYCYDAPWPSTGLVPPWHAARVQLNPSLCQRSPAENLFQRSLVGPQPGKNSEQGLHVLVQMAIQQRQELLQASSVGPGMDLGMGKYRSRLTYPQINLTNHVEKYDAWNLDHVQGWQLNATGQIQPCLIPTSWRQVESMEAQWDQELLKKRQDNSMENYTEQIKKLIPPEFEQELLEYY